MSHAMLEVRELSKSFGGLKAVDQASLDVRQGEIVGLIGPNGAGKTTLFAAIAGFLTPDSGRVAFEGHRHHRPRAAQDLRRRHGAHVPDHPALRQDQRAREHHGRRLFPHRRPAHGRARGRVGRRHGRHGGPARPDGRRSHRRRPQAAGACPRARHRAAAAAARRGDGRPQPDGDRRDRRRHQGDPQVGRHHPADRARHAGRDLARRAGLCAEPGPHDRRGHAGAIAEDPQVIEAYLGHGAAKVLRA